MEDSNDELELKIIYKDNPNTSSSSSISPTRKRRPVKYNFSYKD